VRAALAECRRFRSCKVVFPKGRYEFRPDLAYEEYLFISNNDEGLKRIAFALVDMEDVEIDGQGSSFVFHGTILPFVVERSHNVKLSNFSVDWQRTFHSEGRVLRCGPSGVDVEFSQAFPFTIQNGFLRFLDESRNTLPIGSVLEFDTVRREPAYGARDQWTAPDIQALPIAPGMVRLLHLKFQPAPGNTLVFAAANRNNPAITISESSGIQLNHVDIYHAGGMGVIAQRSRDIELDHVRVTPAPGSCRVLSVPADATHFVNCRGRIVISNCLFECQNDDATNIHGIYGRIAKRINARTVLVQLVHRQQYGFDLIHPGETLELVHPHSLITFGLAVPRTLERLNKELTQVSFAHELPAELKVGDGVAAIAYPDVTITHCTVRNNRARGFLLGSRGKIVIEDNVFHTAGSAIQLEGDLSFWFEQAGVRNLTIRRNRFENCNFGSWGNAVIEVRSRIDPKFRSISFYNRNIVIEDNLFRMFDQGRYLRMYSVDGIIFRHNRVERTKAYPPRIPAVHQFDITDSSHVEIQE